MGNINQNNHILTNNIPKHVAIIMDGNGRWAVKRNHPRIWGHVRGTSIVKDIVRAADEIGIKILTLYAFSTENWLRPKLEVKLLMKLLRKYLIQERKELIEKNVKLTTIGNLDQLPESVLQELMETKHLTINNTGLILNFAFSYGGRQEIIQGIQSLSYDLLNNKIKPEEINENVFSNYLYTKDFPDPDLLIRTSGEYRISNFLLWQCAYTEFYITPIFWPDFSVEEFHKAIHEYQKRERRFGKTAYQIQNCD